jgi:bifunctional UDP-N-acetylglucosamine pyrophosphorylase/glucosamine-1-phosphate N-acetyltransferase
VVVVGHQAHAVEQALRAVLPAAALRFVLQKKQLGTAHAVLAAKSALRGFAGPVLILTGDTPLVTADTLQTVMTARQRARVALAFGTMTLENPSGYGRVVHGPHGSPVLIVEDRDATEEERAIREVNAGLYCVDSGFLWKTLGKLDSKNAQGEFYLPDMVALAAKGPGTISAHLSPVEAVGVNDREELAAAARALVRRKARALMQSGVTIEDPERFDCDEDVEVGADTVIEPNVRLAGKTRIGKHCRIGQGSILKDATVADGAIIGPYTLVDNAVVGRNAVVGPLVQVRPERAGGGAES